MTAIDHSGQGELFPLPHAVQGGDLVLPAAIAANASDWRDVTTDPREATRVATLTETGQINNTIAAARGAGTTALRAATSPGLARRDWTPEGRAVHLARAAETRAFLEAMGLPATKAARERASE